MVTQFEGEEIFVDVFIPLAANFFVFSSCGTQSLYFVVNICDICKGIEVPGNPPKRKVSPAYTFNATVFLKTSDVSD